MFTIIENILARAGYVRADSIVKPEPVVVHVTERAEYAVLPNGKIIYPLVVDTRGNPIQFERGVSYSVGSNGRWRKRRTVKQKDEVTTDNEVTGTPRTAKLAFSGNAGDSHFSQAYSEERRLHRHWENMMASCYDSAHHNYERIGARGVTVCENWKRSYKRFEADIIALGGAPARHSMRLLDPAKPFGPENIAFKNPTSSDGGFKSERRKFTEKEIRQIRNSRQSVSGLAQIYGVNTGTISQIQCRRTYRDIN